MREVQLKTAKATEVAILDQLNGFIKRGLIVVEINEQFLCQSIDEISHTTKIEVRNKVVLKLRDQEYIEKLEKRVSELSSVVSKVQR